MGKALEPQTLNPQMLTALSLCMQRPAAAAEATPGAATMQARQPAQQRYSPQSIPRATYGSGSLRMDEF